MGRRTKHVHEGPSGLARKYESAISLSTSRGHELCLHPRHLRMLRTRPARRHRPRAGRTKRHAIGRGSSAPRRPTPGTPPPRISNTAAPSGERCEAVQVPRYPHAGCVQDHQRDHMAQMSLNFSRGSARPAAHPIQRVDEPPRLPVQRLDHPALPVDQVAKNLHRRRRTELWCLFFFFSTAPTLWGPPRRSRNTVPADPRAKSI